MSTTNEIKEFYPIFKFALREDLKNDKRFLPTKAEPFALGYDVRVATKNQSDIILRAGQYFKIPLGFRSFCPLGWGFELHPRSSSFAKKSIHTLIGIIDETFPLECQIIGQYIPDLGSLGKDLTIKFGDAIGQIIPVRRQSAIIEDISNEEIDRLFEERKAPRTGGIGSTG
jgi:dUTPase